MKRLFALALCLAMLLALPCAQAAQGLPLQDCHRVTMTQGVQGLPNGARITAWTADTVQDAVDEELNALAAAYAADMKPLSGDGRLTVTIRPSRTGLTWMSFMVQGRGVYSQKTREVRFTTRTYDMTTGERVLLTDIFPEDSAAWDMMAQAVREGIAGYYPALTAPQEAVDLAASRESLEQAEFTLHGLSLVLHLDATIFYPEHPQLIEVPLYYPDYRPYMTEKAQVETDNLNYYHTAALTIDDGPNGIITEGVLNSLLKNGERATFFLVGLRMKQQAFIVQREHDEGHAIGSHNWEHCYSNVTARSVLRTMPPKIIDAHESIIGYAPAYLRAPGGRWEGLAEIEMGWPYIQWTVSAEDWSGGEKGPDPYQTSSNIVYGTEDGGIILMHDLKENSIESIDIICRRLQEKGFILLTVDELFIKDGVILQPDQAYWRCTDGVTTR